MFNNAEFLRNVRVQLTPRRLAFTCGLTVGLILISELLIWSATSPTQYSPSDYDRIGAFGTASFNLLFFAQVILLVAMAPSMLGGNMIQERLRNTLIFQQMTLLSPHEVLLGKMFGSTAICYILAALLMPFAFVSGLLAKVSIGSMIGAYLVLFIGALSWQAVSLFFSTSAVNANENVGRNLAGLSYSIGGLAVFFMIIFFNIFWRRNWEFQEETTYFFGLPIFNLSFALLVMAFVGFWAYVGAVRAFKDMQLVLLSPRTIWYFFITLEVLLVGWFWGAKTVWEQNLYSEQNTYQSEQSSFLILAYLVINWVFLTALAGISAISRNQLQEWWSGGDDAVSMLKRTEIKNSVFNYPIAVAIALIGAMVLWVSIYLRFSGESLTYHFPIPTLLAILLGFAVTMVSAASFIQFCAMFRFKVANRAGAVLWIMLIIVAGIASGIFGPYSIPGFFNPILFAGVLIDDNIGISSTMAYGLIIEIAFALLSIGFMYWKWRRTREEMLRDKA
ncbi:MAG: hypothetical protein HY819_06435 [Acidobacteria bacterium]|nr:hypothetical protein [Acidobacteriota bacterium]